MAQATDITGLPTDSRVGTLLSGVIALMAVTTLFVGLRVYIRHQITHSLWWDDWTMLIALAFTIMTGIDMCIMVKFGGGSHIYTLANQTIKDYFLCFYLSIVFYNAGLGVIKISLLLQYYRIFSHHMRRITLIAMGIIGMWCTALVLTSIFSCTPIEGFWNKDIEARCIPQIPQWYINAAGNIATDLFIFALPIPVLWKLKLPLSQRLSLVGVFGIGFFTCTISVIRISFLSLGDDTTYENVGPAIWSIAELSCGIIGSCLPTLRPVVVRLFPFLGGSSRDKSSRTYHRAGSEGGATTHRRTHGYGSSTVVSSRGQFGPSRASMGNLSSMPEEYEIESGLKSPSPTVPDKDYFVAGESDSDDKELIIQLPQKAAQSHRMSSYSGRNQGSFSNNGVVTTINSPSGSLMQNTGPLNGIHVKTETFVKES